MVDFNTVRLWTEKYHTDIGRVLHEGEYINLF